jgi:hypothetical protein
MNTDVLVKRRAIGIVTRTGQLDYSHEIFQDDQDFFIISLTPGESPHTFLTFPHFSLEFVEKIKEIKKVQQLTTLCLFGGVVFELMTEKNEFMDFLVFTELLDRKEGLPIVGGIDYHCFEGRYDEIFCSRVYLNEVGRWRFRVYRLKRND